MSEYGNTDPLAQVDWVRRAAARIRQRDDVMRLSDAADLAAALWRRSNLREVAPEAAVDQVFEGGTDAPGQQTLPRWPASDA